jgi:hypothetical protein
MELILLHSFVETCERKLRCSLVDIDMASLKTIATLVGVAATVGLAGYALMVVQGDGEVIALESLLGDAEPEAPESHSAVDERRQRLAAMARGMGQPQGDSLFDEVEEPPPATRPDLEITRDDARAGFDYVMRNVERVGRKRRRLSQGQWQETWRTANDAYAALSIQLDGDDPGDLAELEEAHRRLKKGLRRVRVKGGKFRPQ